MSDPVLVVIAGSSSLKYSLVDAGTGEALGAGLVERIGEGDYPEELLLRLDEPAPGIAHLFALPMGGQVYLPTRVFLYGDRAASVAARDEPRWQAWMNEHFAPAEAASAVE